MKLKIVKLLLLFLSLGIIFTLYSNYHVVNLRIMENQWQFTPDFISISKNKKWKLKIYNEDSYSHSFFISELNINQELPPHKETIITILAERPGVYTFFCSTVCGEGHYRMNGQIEIK